MQYADKLSDEMSDYVGSDPSNNNVGSVMNQIYPTDNSSDNNILTALGQTAQKTLRAEDKYAGQSVIGSYNSSPLLWASHLTNFAKFFNGAEKGNAYTDNFKKPQKTEPLQAQNPNTFYAKWYEDMRRFAEAQEVADRGQTTVRTR